MKGSAANEQTEAAFAQILAGFDALDAAGVTPQSGQDASNCIRRVEQLRRRADGASLKLLNEIKRAELHREDGFASAKSMMRHHAKLSNGEAAERDRAARLCSALPQFETAYTQGQIPTDNVRLLGRLHANPRVAYKMTQAETWFLERAGSEPAKFVNTLKRWEQLADEDGPEPEALVQRERRNFRIHQDFDRSWRLTGRHGSMQGAAMNEIFVYYLEAETQTDWEKAKAEHGVDARACHLPRSIQQRAADAMWQIFQDAAGSPAGSVPPSNVHNIVWNEETFEHYLAFAMGVKPDEPLNPEDYLCRTVDGVEINPMEAVVNATITRFRRVVINSKSTLTDLGEARYFTGNSKLAVKLASTECVWPGCNVSSSRCEADHLVEHSKGGRTNPGNGAPLCGKHNRWKQKGFTIWRSPTGSWHTYRSDGTEIDP